MSEPSSISVTGPCTPDTALPNPADWDKLDALLQDLPPGMPLLPPEDAGNFEKYTNRPRNLYVEGDGWKNCARALEKFDSELCKGYREEIDTLLVFAGLFSAVVTAFTIESYQWLQDDATEALVILLSQIAQSVSPNSTGAPLFPTSTGLPDSVAVRINVYWFLALALSLSAALVAILCKQWIREFERNAALTPDKFVGIHQTKLEGLKKWRLGAIISVLPLLLQLALAIFALGILELLWQLHAAVAAVVCVPTIVAFAFYGATTALPALSFYGATPSECPYKSPQALIAFPIYQLYLWIKTTMASGASYVAYLLLLTHHHLATGARVESTIPPPVFEGRFRRPNLDVIAWHNVSYITDYWLARGSDRQLRPIYRSLRWIHMNLDADVREWIWRCLWERATLPDPGYLSLSRRLIDDAGSHKRGFHYVEKGKDDLPPTGLRALALSYLRSTNASPQFVVEAYIQNLNSMDSASAEYLTDQLFWVHAPRANLDPGAVATIMRAVCAYGRSRVQEPIGGFLVLTPWMSVGISDLALRTAFLRCTLLLFQAWLGSQPVPHSSTTIQLGFSMARVHCDILSLDPEDYCAHPERLRRRPDIPELAKLVSTHAQSDEDPAAALGDALFPGHQEEIRPMIQELLDIARHGIGQDAAATSFSAPGDGAHIRHASISPIPDARPQAGLALPITEHSPALSTEANTQSHSQRSTGCSTATPAHAFASHRPDPENPAGEHGLSCGASAASVLLESSTLRSVVISAPSGNEHARTPSGNSEGRQCVNWETTGLNGGGGDYGGALTLRLLEVPVTHGGSEQRGTDGPIPHAAVIHTPPRADAQMLPEHDRAVAFREMSVQAIRKDGDCADDTEGSSSGGFGVGDSATRAVHALSRVPLSHAGTDSGH